LGGSPFGSRGCRDERRCARHVFLQIRADFTWVESVFPGMV
jgi:hypothetical protein